MFKNIVYAIPFTSLIGADIPADVYTPINPDGLDQPCFLLRIINGSNASFLISYDGGTTAHDLIMPSSTVSLYAQTNAGPTNLAAYFARGFIVSVFPLNADIVGPLGLAGYFQPAQN